MIIAYLIDYQYVTMFHLVDNSVKKYSINF